MEDCDDEEERNNLFGLKRGEERGDCGGDWADGAVQPLRSMIIILSCIHSLLVYFSPDIISIYLIESIMAYLPQSTLLLAFLVVSALSAIYPPPVE